MDPERNVFSKDHLNNIPLSGSADSFNTFDKKSVATAIYV